MSALAASALVTLRLIADDMRLDRLTYTAGQLDGVHDALLELIASLRPLENLETLRQGAAIFDADAVVLRGSTVQRVRRALRVIQGEPA